MDKIENPYSALLERLQSLEQSTSILTIVNNDLRQILHKHKPLPKFIQDSFKRASINRSKTLPTSLAIVPIKPIETEEMLLAASIIDRAKRTIENVGEKKSKPNATVTSSITTSIQSGKVQTNRPRSSSTTRPSMNSTPTPTTTDSSALQPAPVRRYLPAHMKAPFMTQPEKKRRPTSSNRSSAQTNSTTRLNSNQRSNSQNRQPPSKSSTTQQSTQIHLHTLPKVPIVSNVPTLLHHESNLIEQTDEISDHLEGVTALTIYDATDKVDDDLHQIDESMVPQPIILNRALIKPLRRVWKQNEQLRSRLSDEVKKKPNCLPRFIERLNEQIQLNINTEQIIIPNIEALIVLAIKLRAIILHFLEHSAFDNLSSALQRLSTIKYFINQYHHFFSSSQNISAMKSQIQAKNVHVNVENSFKRSYSDIDEKRKSVRYTDDSQLIAFTEIRFQQFENECRWIELNWHEQMIKQFKQTLDVTDRNRFQLYRELMSLVTGLQTSTPIVVENRS